MASRIFKAEGLILRTCVLGEADRLVTLLSWEEGKFEAVARGARKIKSKLAAGVDIFTYGRFTLHRGKTWPTITGQDAIEHFYWFRDEPDLYAYGLYFAELTDRLVAGKEQCADICRLLLESWRLLGEQGDYQLLCRTFELKLASSSGYSPHLHGCLQCGSGQTAHFSPRQGGLLCRSCLSGDAFNLEPGSIALARRLIEVPLAQVKQIRPSPRQRHELTLITTALLTYHLDLGEIKSKRLLPGTEEH